MAGGAGRARARATTPPAGATPCGHSVCRQLRSHSHSLGETNFTDSIRTAGCLQHCQPSARTRHACASSALLTALMLAGTESSATTSRPQRPRLQVLRAAGSASTLVPATRTMTRPRVALCRSSRGPYGAPMMCTATGTSVKELSEQRAGECLRPSPPPPPTLPVPCTHEANAQGDRACVLADVMLRRAGGRPLELPEQPSQAGLDGRGRRGRESRPHACSLVCTRGHTGRAHVPKPLLRAASVRQVADSFGPRVFACAESRLCSCLGVSGMAAYCSR